MLQLDSIESPSSLWLISVAPNGAAETIVLDNSLLADLATTGTYLEPGEVYIDEKSGTILALSYDKIRTKKYLLKNIDLLRKTPLKRIMIDLHFLRGIFD